MARFAYASGYASAVIYRRAEIAREIAHRGIVPILDFAYQGFGEGLVEDAASLRAFLATGCEVLVASSSSKNFALYNERVGALAIVGSAAAKPPANTAHPKLPVVLATVRPTYPPRR